MISPEQLRRFPLFSGLDAGDLKAVAMMSEEVSFNPGEWVFEEGQDADALYVILRGMVDLRVKLDAKGTNHAELDTLIEGQAVGWSAVVEPHLYCLSCVAASQVQLVRFDSARMRDWMAENPAQGYILMQRIAQVMKTRLTNLRIRFVSLTETG